MPPPGRRIPLQPSRLFSPRNVDLASILDGAMVYGRPFGLVGRSSAHAVGRKKFGGVGWNGLVKSPFRSKKSILSDLSESGIPVT